MPSSKPWLGVARSNSSLRPESASLYTGDLGRKARQPRGGPKGAGSDWSEATSCTFWQLPGSARHRPLCALLPALPPFPCYRIQPHSFLFFLSLSGFLWKFEPRFVQFSYLFRGVPEGNGLKDLLLKRFCTSTELCSAIFFIIWILKGSNVITLLEEGIVYCYSLCMLEKAP